MMLKSTTMLTKPSEQLPIDWKPHDYQKKAIKFLLKNSYGGLFLCPGLGKTGISLAAIKILLKEKLIERALIIAPLRVCYSVWPKEAKKWSAFNGLRTSILHGKDKEKNLEKEADIYIINPEGLQWLLGHKTFKKKFKGTALFIDESSKFKHTNTKRFKLLRRYLPQFARRYVLTGSPAPNGLLDLFGQIYIIDLGASLGQYVTHYRSKYFYPTGYGGYEWKLQEGAAKLIHAAVKPLTLRLAAEDYLELPKLIINDIYVDLDEKSREIYDEMEEDLISAIKRKEIVASSAAVASNKCSQIANGGIYDENKKAHFVHGLKAEVVEELVGELNGSPALIAYEFSHDLDRLRLVLGKDVPYIGGGVSPKRAADLEVRWNRGELPVLLGQPASIAHGLNIQEAGNHVIWHSLTWNFEFYDQFIKRVLRQGNLHSKVYVHRIIVRNSVDELKIAAMNNKFRTQNDLFEALKQFLKRKSFTSVPDTGRLEIDQEVERILKEEKKMGKFDKKPKEENAEPLQKSVEGAKKPKLWTNDEEWQNQETGENTPAGTAQLKKVAEGKIEPKDLPKLKTRADKEPKTKEPKMTKTATAKKPAKEAASTKLKAGKAEKAPAKASNDDRKILFVQKENPKRGTAAERFALYAKGMTVGEYVKKGGKKADVSWDEKQGFIKVSVK